MNQAIRQYLLRRVQEVTDETVPPTSDNLKRALMYEAIMEEFDDLDDKVTAGCILAFNVRQQVQTLRDLDLEHEPTGADLWDVLNDLEAQADNIFSILTKENDDEDIPTIRAAADK